jgi:hypothetical protein
MIDPTKVNLDELPKKFCDGAIGGFNKDTFIIVPTSGTDLTPLITTPQIAKSIAAWMQDNIASYEKQFGVIDMTLPQIPSPIQSSDLNRPGK